jgi:hypothetical protein
VEAAGNYSLTGDATALTPADLQGRIAGYVEAPEPFVPLLRPRLGEQTRFVSTREASQR